MNIVKACFDSMHSQSEKENENKWREAGDLTSQGQGTEDTMGQMEKQNKGEKERDSQLYLKGRMS